MTSLFSEWTKLIWSAAFGLMIGYYCIESMSVANAELRGGAEPTCSSYGTVDKTCGDIGGNKCTKTHTICKWVEQGGTKTLLCQDSGDGVDPWCVRENNCSADSNASTDDRCNPQQPEE